MPMPRIQYEVGHKFPNTKLSYVCEEETHINSSGYKTRVAKFKCECGNYHVARIKNVKNGNCVSCGCVGKSQNGLSSERLYQTWYSMKSRCYDKTAKDYHNYGAKGVTVCDEWRESYLTFREWSHNNGYEEHLTIEREKNNLSYCPDNCMWLAMKLGDGPHIQNWNTTVVNIVHINGVEYPSIAEAERQTGHARATIRKRCDNSEYENYSRELKYPK